MSYISSDSSIHCCENETQINSSSSTHMFESEQWTKSYEQINFKFLVAELIVAIFAILGNALVIIVFFKERKIRRKQNYYIISLAFADFFVGTIGIPFCLMLVRHANSTKTICLPDKLTRYHHLHGKLLCFYFLSV